MNLCRDLGGAVIEVPFRGLHVGGSVPQLRNVFARLPLCCISIEISISEPFSKYTDVFA